MGFGSHYALFHYNFKCRILSLVFGSSNRTVSLISELILLCESSKINHVRGISVMTYKYTSVGKPERTLPRR